MNGTRSDLSWHEMRKLFWHPYFVGLVLAASAFVIALRPYDDMVELDVIRLTIFYANSVSFFLMLLVGSVYLLQRLGRTVYASLTVALAIIAATIYGITSATLLGAMVPPVIDIVLVTVFNLVFGVVGEVIFASFLVPRILKDISSERGPPVTPQSDRTDDEPLSPAQPLEEGKVGGSSTSVPQSAVTLPPVVNILGSNFDSDEVSLLSAEAHYVSIVQRSGKKKLLRGRISDAVDAMPPEQGRLVHRSHWVAAHAVDSVVQEGRNFVLLLKDGKRLPIARNRQHEIRNWISQISE